MSLSNVNIRYNWVTVTFSKIIYVIGVFAWPMTSDAWDSYAFKNFVIFAVFEIFGRLESSFFFRSWVAFQCTDKLLMGGYNSMFPVVSS